jgi:phosphatidylglycerol lysyltransferase
MWSKLTMGRMLGTRLVAAVALGSGLVNVFSVIGPALPARARLVRDLFPLEFIHLSRFFTLLIGFSLIISSINLYKGKKRAFRLVLLLTLLSIVFHLTKGFDYEEAIVSVGLLVLLLLTRKLFVVKSSSIPDLRAGLVRLSIAFLAALLYGVAGFWFLDTREFGINFTIGDSIHRTLLFLSLVGDPDVVPRTSYARWFVNSMYLMTVTAIAYSLFAVFRPVVYRYRTLPHERKLAENLTVSYGRSALDYFKYWSDKTFFFSSSEKCYVSYKVGAGHAMALGDPIGPEEEIEPTIRLFVEFCQENDWRVAFHQTLPDFLPVYRKLGFRKLKIGDDAIVQLKGFSLEGRKFKKLRHNINQLEKDGYRLLHYPPPVAPETLGRIKDISDDWLRIPGRRERTFTLGHFDPDYVRHTPIYAAVDGQGRMLAFANEIPSFRKGEATIDLMRHRADAPNNIMDYLFTRLFLLKSEEGFESFNMGMAPLAGFEEKEEASLEEHAVHNFIQRLNFLFSYRGLKLYKAKFASTWEPRYLVYRNVLSLPMVARAISEVSEFRS